MADARRAGISPVHHMILNPTKIVDGVENTVARAQAFGAAMYHQFPGGAIRWAIAGGLAHLIPYGLGWVGIALAVLILWVTRIGRSLELDLEFLELTAKRNAHLAEMKKQRDALNAAVEKN